MAVLQVSVVLYLIARFLFMLTAIVLMIAVWSANMFIVYFRFLTNWLGLGLSLIYLGILSYAGNTGNSARDTTREVACWIAIGVGVAYCILVRRPCGPARAPLLDRPPWAQFCFAGNEIRRKFSTHP